MRLAALVFVPVLLLGHGCSHDDDVVSPREPVPAGAMAYAGYDDDGVQVVEGWVRLDLAIVQAEATAPVGVTGTWKLRRVGPPGEVGPQIGEGRLEATLDGDQLFVNFNPGHADDNVFAGGAFTVNGGPASRISWEGTWRWATLLGTRRSGSFSAGG